MDISDIVEAIRDGRVRITDHADEQAEADDLALDAVYVAVLDGEIIEDCPDDRPYPSCLIYGRASGGDPIHSVWAYNEASGWAVLVTVYRPDPERWIDWRERKPS